MANQFLIKKAMVDMRNLCAAEITELQNGNYLGVQLLGYYEQGDTPAPIYYFLSDTNETDDGGSIIELESIKFESKFKASIHAAYFGLIANNGRSPSENKDIIQKIFIAGLRYNVKDIYLSEGVFEITGGGINYDISYSRLYFLGELKLSNSSNLGEVQFIRYRGNNITVYNQRLDGNRANNSFNNQAGTQCNFATYGVENILFKGGYSKNSLQSHIHSTAENLIIEDMLFDTSGEHGLYLTLGIDQPKNKVTLRNCTIKNWGVGHAGAGLSLRDYRNALIERCIFDPTESMKPESIPIINTYVNYRSSLGNDESLKHLFKDCIFMNGGSVTNGIRCLTVADKGVPIEEMNERGNGIYIQGGILEYPAVEGVVEMRDVLIKPNGNPLTFNKLPRNLIRCVIENILYSRPLSPKTCNIEGNQFSDTNSGTVASGILFDFNAEGVLTGGLYSFKNNLFINFKNSGQNGIIRNVKSDNTLILDGNKLKDCTNAVLIYNGNSTTNTILNNADLTNSGVRLRFASSSTPKLVGNNDFIVNRGTTMQRPVGISLYVGLAFDNLTTGQLEVYDGTVWTTRTPIASKEIKGIVNQASAQPDSFALDLEALINDFNALLFKLRTAGIISKI